MPKILIADDSIAVRKVAERLLTEAGLGVTLAANGEEALAYLAKERPDVVVSDVIMPDKSGYEVCAFVRGNPTLATTPVLLISGIVNDEVTKQAESCRADGVLKKPFQGTSLKDRVLELMAKRREAVSESPVATRPASDHTPAPVEKAPLISIHQQDNMNQSASKLKEIEDQLQTERARSEELTKQLSEAMEQRGRAKESEAQLDAERRRFSDLESKLAKLEPQTVRIPELEAALKAEQDRVETLNEQVLTLQKASGRIAELESALNAERAAAEQLVQQLADAEQISAKVQDAEERLLSEQKQVAELQQRIKTLETEFAAEQRKHTETEGRLQEAEKTATKVQELEGLLVAERERNGVLSRQVVETEQAAENATKRFEEMARKLSEIAGLASQLGNGKGQS
jgi:CheY-like chemotaxis protein